MDSVAILHYAAPPILGGVESTIARHARLLARSGHQVHIIAGRGGMEGEGITFHHLPLVDSRHPEILEIAAQLREGLVPPQFAAVQERIAAQLRPIFRQAPVVIAHNVVTLHKNLPLTAALHRLVREDAVRLIAWCHDFAWQDALYIPEMHAGFPWDLLRTPWEKTRYVVVSTPRREKLAALLRVPAKRIRVVPPGIDAAAFLKLEPLTRRLMAELSLLEAEPLMLLPARITRRKNIELGVRITAALQKSHPEAALVVTGPPGPHNPANRAYLEELLALRDSLGARVHFLYQHGEDGAPLHIPDPVLADLYRLADLLLFPSLREGFGIPILEAGLTRLPVFAADLPPIRESSAGHAAHFFDPRGDAEEIARRIARFAEEDTAYRLRRRVLRHYRWEAILKEHLVPLIKEASPHG